MKQLSALLLFTAITVSFLLTHVQSVNAGQFASSYIRLDRTKSSTALSGLVCAKPSSAGAGTEAKVSIQFPSDFTISSTLGNFTTSTSDIPSGATAWPSIGGSASVISGTTVTITSSDLTNGSALYCFNFTASSSTTGSTGSKTGTIVTKNSSDATIDSSDYGITIVSNDQITISATVPASSSDYSLAISKITAGTQYPQETEIEYQLTYGTGLNYATAITIEASWSQGTIDGDSTPSVEVLNYVSGSASTAYNSTPPVIDTTNKTIAWEINSFPGNTLNETVNFKLKTTSGYSGSSLVNFTASGRILFPGGATSYNDQSAYYKYISSSSSSSSSSSPTSTPTPTPNIPIDTKPKILNVEVRTISNSAAGIYVETSIPTTKIIRYGKSVSNLNLSKSVGIGKTSIINLTDLTPSTQYFFRIYSKDGSGNQIVSDIYTFTSAGSSLEIPIVEENSLVITSNNNIIYSSAYLNTENKRVIFIPQDTVFNLTFSLKNNISVKKIHAIVRPKNQDKVLGFSNFLKPGTVSANTETADLIEISPKAYTGRLRTTDILSDYELYTKTADDNGNITEQRIADIKVIRKLKVFSKKTGQPAEGVRIYTYIYNNKSRLFSLLTSQNFSIENPNFTDRNGEINLVLPRSKYKINVSGLGYKEQNIIFEIDTGDGYPRVYLESETVTPISFIKYQIGTLREVVLSSTYLYIDSISDSFRFFDLLATLSLSGLVLLTLLAFSKRNHIPVTSMFSYFFYFLDHKARNEKYIHGVVYDDKEKPIPQANVYLADSENEQIISTTKTSKHGEFFFKKQGKNYLIMVMSKGYESTPFMPYEDREHLKFKINMIGDNSKSNIFEIGLKFIFSILGISFEFLAILTVVFELIFLITFGIPKTLPFLSISIFNLLLWTLYLRHRHLITHHS